VAFVRMDPPAVFINRQLSAMGNDIRSFREPLTRIIKQAVIPAFHGTFDKQGPGWQPLSDKTKLHRTRMGYPPGPILDRKRGAVGLRARFTAFARWDINGIKGEAEFTGLPNLVSYGNVLHSGYGNIPERPFIFIPSHVIPLANQIMADWVQARANRYARRIGGQQ